MNDQEIENKIRSCLTNGAEHFASRELDESGANVGKNDWEGRITQSSIFKEIKDAGRMKNKNWDKDYKRRTYTDVNTDIQDNLNEIAVNLSRNYNKTASIYNKQSDILNRHNDLVESDTKKLDKQLQDLSLIQNEVALKSRIIELNEEQLDKKLMNKEIIVGFFITLPLLFIPIIMMFYNLSNNWVGLVMIFLIVIGYIIYAGIVYRRHTKRYFPLKADPVSEFRMAAEKYYKDERDRIKKELQEYKYGKCKCPAEEASDDEEFEKYMNKMPSQLSLSKYNELFRLIGCRKDLTDDEVNQFRKMPNMSLVINEMKNIHKLASSCKGDSYTNELCLPGNCGNKNYLLNVNGPFKYNDGSAPTEQIYPRPVGSVDVALKSGSMVFPREVWSNLDKIDNPLKRLFFIVWGYSLLQNGISFNDPRFKTKLNIIELEVSGNTPEPYWGDFKMPLVNNMDSNIKKVCQKYNEERKDLGIGSGKFLTDAWNFFYAETIPMDIYDKWLKKLNRAAGDEEDLNYYYEEFVKEIMTSEKFLAKYDNEENFMTLKLKEMMNTFDTSYMASEPEVTEIFS